MPIGGIDTYIDLNRDYVTGGGCMLKTQNYWSGFGGEFWSFYNRRNKGGIFLFFWVFVGG